MISAEIERCAGIDVGKKFLAVCIMVGPLTAEPRVEHRKFGTTVADLEALRAWLQQEGITHVAMESTGSYWKPVFNILEDAVQVCLANPKQVKPRKGHNTDKKDGWWLAHLLRHAMVQASFIPKRDIRELRDLTRRRKRLLGAGSSEKNRIQKVLEDANVKLGNVLSDIFGVSGQLMLDALLEGKASAEEIAQHAKQRARKKIPEIVAAVQQHRSDHHRRRSVLAWNTWSFSKSRSADWTKPSRPRYGKPVWKSNGNCCRACRGCRPPARRRYWRRPGRIWSSLGNPGHLSSWAGVCPGNNRSAGKNKSSHTTGSNP